MRLIDSHCHLHDSSFFDGESRELHHRVAAEAGVGIICVGTDELSSLEAVEFAASHDQVWAAIGVHPHDAKVGWSGIERQLRESRSPKIVAIGEIGLDYFYDNSPRDIQQQAFAAQLQLAVDYDLPVSFHVRDAFDDFWSIFDSFSGIRGVLHSFTDSQANLDKALERGLSIGINGISTFTKDLEQQQVFRKVPLERVLLETDAPFLTPHPIRGKINTPASVELVADFMAKDRDISVEAVHQATLANTKLLFGI